MKTRVKNLLRSSIGLAAFFVLQLLLPAQAMAQPSAAHWMGDLKSESPKAMDQPVAQFIFPGTHLSGAYELKRAAACQACGAADAVVPLFDLMGRFFKTQNQRVRGQLDKGARAFDLRFFRATAAEASDSGGTLTEGEFYIYNAYAGPAKGEIFSDINGYLGTAGNDKEVIILHFRGMFKGINYMDGADLADFFSRLFTDLGAGSHPARFAPSSLGATTSVSDLQSLGHQVIVVYDGPVGIAATNRDGADLSSAVLPFIWHNFQSVDFTTNHQGAYPRAEAWNNEDKLFAEMTSLVEIADNSSQGWHARRTDPGRMFEMSAALGPDQGPFLGISMSAMTFRWPVCNLINTPLEDLVALIIAVLPVDLTPEAQQVIQSLSGLLDDLRQILTAAPELRSAALKEVVALQAVVIALNLVLYETGVCPADSNDWDRFGSLREVANWTNPKVLPALVGLPRDQVNIVLSDYYPDNFTTEAKKLNKGVARVDVIIHSVEELECHDCLSFTPDPDYYPLLTFFGDEWPVVDVLGIPFFDDYTGNWGGRHFVTSGTSITPGWRAVRAVPQTLNTTTAGVRIKVIDLDFFPDLDDISQIDGSNEFKDISVPIIGCDSSTIGGATSCDTLGNNEFHVETPTSGPKGILITDSSRIVYSFGECEWATCDRLFVNLPPVAVLEASSFSYEGLPVTLLGRQSSDPYPFYDRVVKYEWDCDYHPGAFVPFHACAYPQVLGGNSSGLTFIPSDGPKDLTVALRVTDLFGAQSALAFQTIHVQNTRPEKKSFSLSPSSPSAGSTATATIMFTDHGIDDTPLPCTVYYLRFVGDQPFGGVEQTGGVVTRVGTTTDPSSGWLSTSYQCSASLFLNFAGAGTYYAFAKITDKDNEDAAEILFDVVSGFPTDIKFTVLPGDTTPPSIAANARKADGSAYTSGTWTNQNVAVSFTCTDNAGGSGVPAGTCPPDQTFTAAGTVTSTPRTVKDAAGNTSAPSNVVTIKIDKTAPTITAAATSSPNAAGWYKGDVTVHFTCSDAGSGIPAGTCPADQTFSAEGAVTSTPWMVVDTAGNTSTSSNVVTVKIDKTAPTASPSQTPAANGPGWNSSDVTVTWNWADSGGSGIDAANCAASDVSSGEGTLQILGSCKDLAGNAGALSNVVTIRIDKAAPTISAAATTAPNGAGWYNGNVIVHFTCADGASGIPTGACPADQTLSAEGAAVASSAQMVTDAAGNTSTLSNVVTARIDKTVPALNPVVGPNPVLLNGTATVTSGAADGLSGLASSSCGALVTNTVGSKSVTCMATDSAGNTSNATTNYNVIYRFDGFLQPINDTAHSQLCGSPCPVSVFKGGSTVPVKFELRDANGTVVPSAGSLPVWLTPAQGGPVAVAIDESIYSEPASAGATYNLTGSQYHYNWSTNGAAAGSFWRIGVTLEDGQTYFVYIGLK